MLLEKVLNLKEEEQPLVLSEVPNPEPRSKEILIS